MCAARGDWPLPFYRDNTTISLAIAVCKCRRLTRRRGDFLPPHTIQDLAAPRHP